MGERRLSAASDVSSIDDDAERVRHEYARRAADPRLKAYYARIAHAKARAESERRQALLEVLHRSGSDGSTRILDVGCGPGDDLAFLLSAGFAASNLGGIDLLEGDVRHARARLPGLDVRMGNGASLPYGDGTFDAVYQTTALSSIVNADVRERVAREMVRVTRNGGLVISYDMSRVADGNPHLVRIDDRELHRLFSGAGELVIRPMTLDMRVAARVPAGVASVLNRIRGARQARFAVLTRTARR
jgi:SAM-dependent methyltransferase